MAADELLRHLVEALEALGIPYALAGSIAAIAYGEPRATLDIDVVAELSGGDVARLKERFPPPQFYMDEAAAHSAIRRREQFNVIHPASGFKADFFVAGDAIERSQLARRQWLPALPGMTAAFSPPEELIIKKLEYYAAGGSDKHLRDIAGMLHISGAAIDRDRIEALAKGAGVLDLWRSVLDRVAES